MRILKEKKTLFTYDSRKKLKCHERKANIGKSLRPCMTTVFKNDFLIFRTKNRKTCLTTKKVFSNFYS